VPFAPGANWRKGASELAQSQVRAGRLYARFALTETAGVAPVDREGCGIDIASCQIESQHRLHHLTQPTALLIAATRTVAASMR